MLVEQTLFGEVDKVAEAIQVLRDLEPPEGYYLADSGGKDSCTVKELANMAGVKYDAHHHLTTIDPPELIYFLKKHHPDTIINKPAMPFLQRMVEKGVYPSRMMRWCCEEYKEHGGSGRLIITGVRKAESNKRSKRKMVETCFKDGSKRYLNIIINWTDSEVWQFIKENGIPYCKLYDEGFERIGCLFCPMASGPNRTREAERYPRHVKSFIKAFEKMHAKKKAEGKRAGERWKDGEQMFRWWMDYNRKSEDPDQTIMFE
jgi:phosphoadenosine phosphosulfate reductase